MTFTDILPMYEGPFSVGGIPYSTSTMGTTSVLSDANKKIAFGVRAIKTGSIDKIGITITNKVGTPPSYLVGCVIADSANYQAPSTTLYSNSTWESFTPTSTGFLWITLNTAINTTLGDMFYIVIKAGVTPPDGSNYIALPNDLLYNNLDRVLWSYYMSSTSWGSIGGGPTVISTHYTTSELYGFALNNSFLNLGFHTDTSPDEVGVKFTLPYTVRALGFAMFIYWNTSQVPTYKIYEGSTLLLTKTWASRDKLGYYLTYSRDIIPFDSPMTFQANTVYRITAIASTNSTTNNIRGLQYADESYRNNFHGDYSNWCLTHRSNGGSWTDVTTDVPMASLYINGIESGGGVLPSLRRKVYVFFD